MNQFFFKRLFGPLLALSALFLFVGNGLLLVGNVFGGTSDFTVPSATNSPFSSMIRPAPAYIAARVLAANVEETHTVPTGYRWVLFSGDCQFYARPNATAAVPAADVTDGTGSEQNPAAWFLNTGGAQVTTIHVIAATACKISLSFYR